MLVIPDFGRHIDGGAGKRRGADGFLEGRLSRGFLTELARILPQLRLR